MIREGSLTDRDHTDKRIKKLKKEVKEDIENERFDRALNTLYQLVTLDERRFLLDEFERENVSFGHQQSGLEDDT